jgi:hypothetical protein
VKAPNQEGLLKMFFSSECEIKPSWLQGYL